MSTNLIGLNVSCLGKAQTSSGSGALFFLSFRKKSIGTSKKAESKAVWHPLMWDIPTPLQIEVWEFGTNLGEGYLEAGSAVLSGTSF